MNIRFLSIIIFLLNLYLIFGETQQCKDIKAFMKENKIPIQTNNDNCCFEVPNPNKLPYLYTQCVNNKIVKFILNMNNGVLNTSHFPELPELEFLTLEKINFKNTLPEILKRIKNKNSSGFALNILESNLDDLTHNLSIPSNINTINHIAIIKSDFTNIIDFPSSINAVDIRESNVKNFDLKKLKNVKILQIMNNPIEDAFFESITKELNQLDILVLDNCEITKIPKTINNMNNLTQLNLSNNRIKVLPDEIFELEKLKWLYFQNDTIIGEFKFNHTLSYCTVNPNSVCTQNPNKQCDNISIEKCDKEQLKAINELKNKIYENKGNDKSNQPSKKPTNLPIYIALIIALVLIIAFAIFFFKYKYNKQDPLIIKDDDNNATYAYKMSDKSKQIMKEFQLNKEKEDKEQNVETITNTRNSNVSLDVSSLEMNNNVINSSDNNVQTTHASQIIGNTSYENINNLSGNNSFINVNNNLSPQNIIYGFNGASSSIPVIINNFSNENMDEAPPYTVTSSVVESKQILQDANDYMDKEELRLQAKIQNEMLATQESLLEKKIKEDKYNDDRKFDGDEPPPYC